MKSEFASLFDLALATGVSHSDLIEQIQEQILSAFRQKYPKSPSDSTVLLDTLTGTVRILSGDEDITPPKFSTEAGSLARQVLINRLGSSSPARFSSPSSRPSHYIFSLLANLFFWGYNLYFILFGLLLTFALRASLVSFGPFRLFLASVILLASPISIVLALKNRLFRRPGLLLKLFFLFESPLIIAGFIPLSLLSHTTPFLILAIFLILSIPGSLYLYETGRQFSPTIQKVLLFIQQSALSLLAYLVFLFSFYIPVIIGTLAEDFLGNIITPVRAFVPNPPPYMVRNSPPSLPDISSLIWGIPILLLVSFLLLLPFLLLLAQWRVFSRTRQSLKSDSQLPYLHAVFAVVIITILALAAYQPSSTRLTSTLNKLAGSLSFAEKEGLARELTPRESQLKAIIKDMPIARSRYFFSAGDTSLKSSYQSVFNLSSDQAWLVQNLFLAAAYPFVYQGESNPSALTYNFQYLFGYSPFDSETAKLTGGLPVRTTPVLLSYRKVTLSPSPQGTFAKVTIEEEYDNTSYSQQEVVYEFTLPPGSVITDLNLGPDLEFPGIIAPKGAAQRTYERELNRRRDPALLEQTGPRQYRLRVFPVPAKGDLATLKGKRQKVAYSYTVLAAKDGYALPEVTRQTNVFANPSTQYLLSSDTSLTVYKHTDRFLPFPSGKYYDVCGNQLSDVSLSTGLTTVSLRSSGCASVTDNLAAITGAKIAVFYDVSTTAKSSPVLDQIKTTLASDPGFLSRNQVDVYKYNDQLSAPTPLSSPVIYFGRSDLWAALKSFTGAYDAVFIVSSSKTALTAPAAFPFSRTTFVYFIHPQAIPPYNLELTSKILQTGGDVTDSIAAALQRFALSKSRSGFQINPNFSVDFAPARPSTLPFFLDPNQPLSPLLNQALYQAYLTNIPVDVVGNITRLDELDKFAQGARIVTPYSSLIALVNEQQKQSLEQFKSSYNRYQDQPATENITPQPIFLNPRNTNMFGSITNPSLGPLGVSKIDTLNFSGGGGGGSMGAFASPSVGSSSSSGLNLFLIANLLLVVPGLGFYLLRLLRRHPYQS